MLVDFGVRKLMFVSSTAVGDAFNASGGDGFIGRCVFLGKSDALGDT